jgi:hypothetical protein
MGRKTLQPGGGSPAKIDAAPAPISYEIASQNLLDLRKVETNVKIFFR